MTFTEFKEAGFTIQVTYDNTQFMQTDVPVEQLANDNDANDLDHDNDEVIETSYDPGSEQFSIYDKDDNCIADSIYTVDDLKETIAKMTK